MSILHMLTNGLWPEVAFLGDDRGPMWREWLYQTYACYFSLISDCFLPTGFVLGLVASSER